MSAQQPGNVKQDGEPDSFPDPKRSWGRSGSLMATWAVLLLAVYFAGWVFDGVVDKTAESSEDEAPGSPRSAAWQFMNFALVDREAGDANGLQCDGDVRMTGTETLAELTEWEKSAGSRANVQLSFDGTDGVKQGDETVYSMQVGFETGPSVVTWKYEVTVFGDGSTFCISKVANLGKVD